MFLFVSYLSQCCVFAFFFFFPRLISWSVSNQQEPVSPLGRVLWSLPAGEPVLENDFCHQLNTGTDKPPVCPRVSRHKDPSYPCSCWPPVLFELGLCRSGFSGHVVTRPGRAAGINLKEIHLKIFPFSCLFLK